MKRCQLRLTTTLVLLCATLLGLSSCVMKQEEEYAFRSWDQIVFTDTLRIGTTTSPSAFFIYRGEEMGTEYAKIREFAQAKGLQLDIRVAHSLDTLMHWVNSDSIDLCITPVPLTRQNLEEYGFCGQLTTSSLMLVQKPTRDQHPIRSVLDLAGKELHVVRGGVEDLRMQQVAVEVGEGIDFTVHRSDTLSVPDLLTLLAHDSIQYTIASEEYATFFAQQHPGVDVKTPISAPIRYGWVVHIDNTSLRDTLSAYFDTHEVQEETVKRYFSYFYQKTAQSSSLRLHALPKGAISPFDSIFMHESQRLGWDWTVLASIAYQESTFQPDVVGWSGAVGLMGLMPSTGRAFGVRSVAELKKPSVSVRVSVDCLLAYQKSYLHIKDKEDRIKFTLAAYNAGPGHVLDARRLAEKYGADKDRWDDHVRKYILLKSNSEYYNDPVCRSGYLRGKETVAYVTEIMERHEAYQAHIKHSKTNK